MVRREGSEMTRVYVLVCSPGGVTALPLSEFFVVIIRRDVWCYIWTSAALVCLACSCGAFIAFLFIFFFFQAEDGIRDSSVTGVQTCALPIYIACQQAYPVSTAANASSKVGQGTAW